MRCWPSDRLSRQLIDLVAEADAFDLARGFRQQSRLVADRPEHAGDRAGVPRRMGADRDVFPHGHVGHSLTWLKRPGDAEFYHFSAAGRLSTFLPSTEIAPPVVVSTPVIRLKVVLLPAPLGPIKATISRVWTSNETSFGNHAAKIVCAPSRYAAAPTALTVRARGRERKRGVGDLARWLERQPRHQPGPDAGRRQLQQADQEDAEHDGFELALAPKIYGR